MTEIFSDGFESGDFSAWTGTAGTPTVVTTLKHHGTYAMYANATNEYAYKDITEQSTLFTRVYVYFDTMARTEAPIAFYGAGGLIARLEVVTTNYNLMLKYLSAGSITSVTSSTTLSPDTWYSIELKAVIHASAGEYRVYLDGSEVADLTQTGLDTDDRGNINKVRVGAFYSLDIPDMYIDDVVVADTYIGPEGAGGLSIPVAMRTYRNLRTAICKPTIIFPKLTPLRL